MNAQTAIRPAVLEALRVPLVTVPVSQGNPRLMSIVTKDGPWTAGERAYVDACEREAS